MAAMASRLAPALARGAVGGAVGTLAMSAVMLAAQKAGLMGRQPPEKLTEAALASAEMAPVEERTEDVAAILAHLAFGMTSGAAFALAHRAVAGGVAPAVSGATFGLGVWALAYKGVIPRLGVLPPPERDRPGRPAAMVAAHVVWGATTGAVVGRRPAP